MYNGSVILSVCVWCKVCVYNGSVIMSVCVWCKACVYNGSVILIVCVLRDGLPAADRVSVAPAPRLIPVYGSQHGRREQSRANGRCTV